MTGESMFGTCLACICVIMLDAYAFKLISDYVHNVITKRVLYAVASIVVALPILTIIAVFVRLIADIIYGG